MKRMFVFTGFLYLLLVTHPANAGLGFLKIFIPRTHASCTNALPPSHEKFCPTFKTAAQCSCTSSGMPASMCRDMATLYKRMIAVFDEQRKACEFQRDTSMQNCMDSWDCYRLGGKDSNGRLCQSTGAACASS